MSFKLVLERATQPTELEIKLPNALPLFDQIIELSLDIVTDGTKDTAQRFKQLAHSKDLPVLAAAIDADADYLITFNTKHYYQHQDDVPVKIVKPGELMVEIRNKLAYL